MIDVKLFALTMVSEGPRIAFINVGMTITLSVRLKSHVFFNFTPAHAGRRLLMVDTEIIVTRLLLHLCRALLLSI